MTIYTYEIKKIMKKTITILFALLLAFTVNAQSLLWKVSGNGLKKPSYIFGTHHLAPLSVLDSIAGFKGAFDASAQIVGEVDTKSMQSPESMQLMQKEMLITNDTTAQMLFSEKEQETVNAFLKANMGFDLTQMPKLKPAFINNAVTMIICAKMLPDFNPQQQLDSYFQNKGAENGKKLLALETIDFQLNMLFNSQSLQRQARLLICAMNDTDKMISDMKELNKAYFSFDLQKMFELSEKKEGTSCDPMPGEMESMIDNRNKDWATKLPAIMKDAPTFIAVGALHLPGKSGLIALLKRQGFTVEPVK